MAKKITMNTLAQMVQRGFEANGKEFEEIHEQLNRIEIQLIAAHDRRLEKAEDNIRLTKTVLKIK